jgi:hypothetical protein
LSVQQLLCRLQELDIGSLGASLVNCVLDVATYIPSDIASAGHCFTQLNFLIRR